jgi:hypothetical protein
VSPLSSSLAFILFYSFLQEWQHATYPK